jgi:hypothetical protein
MPEPGEMVKRLEKAPEVPAGGGERFAGYGVMGLTFTSGHILGLRRFPASSLGPGYTSVWHRDPEGRWSMYQNVSPDQACPRYFGSAVAEATVQDISIQWSGHHDFRVSVEGDCSLRWSLNLTSIPTTRFMNAIGGATPGALWQQPLFLKLMGGAASVALGAGHLALAGEAPNGQRFIANPRLIWTVSASAASLNGQDLGHPGALPVQARLGDFWIPQRGLFVIGSAFMENFDPARHQLTSCQGTKS